MAVRYTYICDQCGDESADGVEGQHLHPAAYAKDAA